MNVFILAHEPVLVKNCRILRLFCRRSGPHRLIFMLVRQFAGNFLLNLCVSPKMRFFARLLVKNRKKGLYFFQKSGMLYPTKALRWIHELLRAVLRSAQKPLFLKLLFSSFTFLSFTLPALQRARKAMTQPARVTAFSFCLCYRRPDHLNALRFTLGIFSGKLFFYCTQASPAELACVLFHRKGPWRVAASAGARSPAGSCRTATEGP